MIAEASVKVHVPETLISHSMFPTQIHFSWSDEPVRDLAKTTDCEENSNLSFTIQKNQRFIPLTENYMWLYSWSPIFKSYAFLTRFLRGSLKDYMWKCFGKSIVFTYYKSDERVLQICIKEHHSLNVLFSHKALFSNNILCDLSVNERCNVKLLEFKTESLHTLGLPTHVSSEARGFWEDKKPQM